MGNKPYTLGSGKLYTAVFDETAGIPSVSELEKEENRIGSISGGATLEYKATYYAVKDDLGEVDDQVITAEEASIKSSVLTWNAATLEKLASTARSATDEDGLTVVKIGGLTQDNGKKYVIHFVHKSGTKRITIVGKCIDGFSLAFAKDKETVVDAVFKALGQDKEGTLIMYREGTPKTTTTETTTE